MSESASAPKPPIKAPGPTGNNVLKPGVSHETPRKKTAGAPRTIKDASQEVIEKIADVWFDENQAEILMLWASGASTNIENAIKMVLGRHLLPTDIDPRLLKALVDLVSRIVSD